MKGKIAGILALIAISLPSFCFAGGLQPPMPWPEKTYAPVTTLGRVVSDADQFFANGLVSCKDTYHENTTVYLDMLTKRVIWKNSDTTYVFGLSNLDAFMVYKPSIFGKNRLGVNMAGKFVKALQTSDFSKESEVYRNHEGGVHIVSSSAVGSSQNGKWYAIASFYLMDEPARSHISFNTVLSCESVK